MRLPHGRLLTAVLVALVTLPAAPAHAASKPAAPTGVRVAPTWNGATVSWNASAGATSYSVCLTTNSTTTTCAYTSRSSAERTATFTDLVPTGGKDYFAIVRATGPGGTTSSTKVGFDLAAYPAPPKATGVAVKVNGTSDATVTWTAVAGATRYVVCLLPDPSWTCWYSTDVAATATSATFSGLQTSGATDLYARVVTYQGEYSSTSDLVGFDLPVPATSGVTTQQPTPTSRTISWKATPNARLYDVQVAENAAMTAGLRSLTSTRTTITVDGSLTPGTTYYVRVRARNDDLLGAWSPVVTAVQIAQDADITVLTWNLCGQDKCVTKANGMKSWSSTRKKLAGAWIRTFPTGIIATQESHDRDTRFITELPGYGVAAYYSAKTLFYDKAQFAVERSGVITLDSARKRYAVWAIFRSLETGARFVVADAHLEPYKGASNDRLREAQTTVLLQQVARANPDDLPVVYAGDYNSNKSNADQDRYPGGYDAPSEVFQAAGLPDSVDLAPAPVNAAFNSANQAKNPPLRYGDHVDHVFVDPRITVRGWWMVLRWSGGRYVSPFVTDHNPIRLNLTIPGT